MLRSAMRELLSALLPAALSLLPLSAAGAGLTEEIFVKEITTPEKLEYLLSLPKDYEADTEKKWPLIVFLHGAGERGDDLQKVGVHGPPKRIREGAELPFVIASPQCPDGEWWTEQPVLKLIDHLEANFRVDPSRIYLSGLSMGGYGTWHFATLAPHRFAAIAPVCGGGVPYRMREIPHLPVWAFHGAKDTVVVPDESARLVESLKKNGSKTVKFTVYPEAAHDSWTETYQNPELYEWFLSHSLARKN
jgi:predicted peptidase